MKEITREKIIEVTKYQAFDGRVFEGKDECLDYEYDKILANHHLYNLSMEKTTLLDCAYWVKIKDEKDLEEMNEIADYYGHLHFAGVGINYYDDYEGWRIFDDVFPVEWIEYLYRKNVNMFI